MQLVGVPYPNKILEKYMDRDNWERKFPPYFPGKSISDKSTIHPFQLQVVAKFLQSQKQILQQDYERVVHLFNDEHNTYQQPR
ncbi:hypothetical protein V6N11_019637 [Hibiscus sabdariffa]|uniref:Uncharacterized protein n=1 Tax=Hibiscus sabdariffa TaxID=183260 RepID=A0ABR2NLB5_9ROSI